MSAEAARNPRGAREGLHLRALGPCVMELDGEPLGIGGPRQRAVLLRLALAAGRLVTADLLIADVWGERAPASVTASLHGYISRLRSLLDDPARLRREGPGYVLDLSADEVDFRRFEALVDEAEAAVDEPSRAVALLDEALALWRGPAFADAADTEWGGPAAVRLEERRLEALERQFDALLDLGRHQAAVSKIEQAVNEHPFRERFTAQLTTALYRCGRQADALRALDRTRRILLDDAGLDPSPELTVLEAAILSHDPALAAPPVEAGPPPVPPAPSPPLPAKPASNGRRPAIADLPPAARRLAGQAFVGRTGALDVMREAWADVVCGQRRLVLVDGEAGSGKSRLAARFATEVHQEGATVLWGRSAEESILPYEPIVEALRTVLQEASPGARDRVLASRPGLQSIRPFVIAAGDPDESAGENAGDGTDRYRLFEAVSDMVHAESQAAPVLCVLDDVQWADLPTLRLVQHVMQHQRPGRLMLIATRRTVPATDNPALESFLAELRRDRLLSRIALDGLSVDEVAELLSAHGSPPAPGQVGEIHSATRGNPFFVTELADHGDVSSVPDSVRDVLGARMARLSPETSALLNAAAVAGATTPLPALAAASGLRAGALVDALDEAIGAGLLAEEQDTNTVVFRHALVQQVVADRLSGTRRRNFHLSVADAYAAMGSHDLDVAHHLLEAGPLVEAERAAAAAVSAGCEAMGLFAYEAAAEWATRALAVQGPTSAEVRCRAMVLMSDAQRAVGDRTAARASAAAATDAAREAGDPLLLAHAAEAVALARAGLGFDFGTEDLELHALLAEAFRGLAPDDTGPAPTRSAAPDEEDDALLRWLPRDGLALAEAQGRHALVATAQLAVRMSIWRVDTLAQRLLTDRQALAAAERSGEIPLILNALLYLVTDLTETGEVVQAGEQIERIRQLAARIRQPVYDAFVDFLDGQRALSRGEYDRCTELADRALLTGRQSHGVNAELAWAGQVFVGAWDRGRLAGMVDLIELAAASAPKATIFSVARSMCLIAGGRVGEARASLDHDLRYGWLDANPDSLWLASGGLVAEIARALDEPEVAKVVLANLRPYEGRFAVTGLARVSLGPISRFIGVAATTAGEHDVAIRALRAAEEQARAAGAVVFEARAAADRAAALERAGGDAGEVDGLRRHAAELAEPLGLVLGPIGPAAG